MNYQKKKNKLLVAVLSMGLIFGSLSIAPTVHAVSYLNIEAGYNAAFAVQPDGKTWGWGSNNYLQLANGNSQGTPNLVEFEDIKSTLSIQSGHYHSLALANDGTVWGWGTNAYGQLGDGTTTTRTIPVQVSGLTDVKQIALGDQYFSMALKNDGTVWAWGYNASSQLGDGTATTRLTPIQITGLTGIKEITAGNNSAYALKNDGTLYAWGLNNNYQLGNGTTTSRTVPGLVAITNVTKIDAHKDAIVVIKNDGTIWGWGYNTQGMLSYDNYTRTPVQFGTLSSGTPTVPVITNAIDVAIGGGNTYVLRADGTVWAAGGNGYGQLGRTANNPTISSVPLQIPGLSNIVKVEAGDAFGLALDATGNFYVWGDINKGDGTYNTSSIPFLVPVPISDITPPNPATLSANITSQTNGNVDVTITYPADALVKQYKIDSGNWISYSNAVAMTTNGTIYARSSDAAGNISVESNYVVSNIDKIPPTTPSLVADKNTLTNQDVTVTVSYSADSVNKEYRINGGTWTAYSVPVVMSVNGLVEARGTDSVGNISINGTYTVSNIDKVAPTTPTLVADKTTATNTSVAVTITFPADATVKEYRINGGTWTAYSVPVSMTANGLVEARGSDAIGNVSTIGSYAVSNMDTVVPTAPTLVADKTTPTNTDVTVTISYPADVTTKEYRINTGVWTSYTAPIVATANETIDARGTDAAGNISTVESYAVSNIDKVAPTDAILTPDTTLPTNQNVTITISYPNDAVVKQYYTPFVGWQTYTVPVVVIVNSVLVYAKSQDAAGNWSNSVSYMITNIDKVAPTTPTIIADKTTATNTNVTVTVTFPADATVKEYRVNNGTWTVYSSLSYTAPLAMTANGLVEARGTDAVGNVSAIGSYTVNNIDTVAPNAPTLVADKTIPTNQNVTVTITYPADAFVKEYRINAGAWTAHTAPIVATANETIEARATDLAGNVSTIGTYTVSNIDKVAPITPTLVADKTTPTNANIAVTVSFPADATVKEYRMNGGAWTAYTVPVAMTANGLVEARGTDDVGNISTIGSYTVSNIDKVAPTTPTLVADKTTTTTQIVIVTASYSTDTAVKEYRINGGAWTAYTAPISMTANGLVEARGTDAVGNVSVIGAYTVSNIIIDTTAPTAPVVTFSGNTVSVQAGTDTESGVQGTYINIGTGFQLYTSPILLSDGTYTIQAKTVDIAGNISSISLVIKTLYATALNNASQAVLLAETDQTQISVTSAKTKVNLLPASATEKQPLLDRLTQVQGILDFQSTQQAIADLNDTIDQGGFLLIDLPDIRDIILQLRGDVSGLPTNLDKTTLNNDLDEAKAKVDTIETVLLLNDASTLAEIDTAQVAVSLLSATPLKTQLQDTINNIVSAGNAQSILLAKQLVTTAESSLVRSDYNTALTEVQKLIASSDKTDLLNRLSVLDSTILAKEQLALAITNATTKVVIAEQGLLRADLNTATLAVNALPTGITKTNLLSRLSQVDIAVSAKEFVGIAETTKLKTDYDNAVIKVSSLPAGTLKTDLQSRLNAIQIILVDPLLVDATTKVKQAETLQTDSAVQKAQDAINLVATSTAKTDLQVRLDAVKKAMADKAYAEQLAIATAKVVQAESYKRDPYVFDAWTLVLALPDGIDKDALIDRLSLIPMGTGIGSSVELIKATAKVKQAETYKRDPYLTDAWTLVNALPTSAEKDALVVRLTVIASNLASVQVAKATAKVQQAETYKRDPYITDAWTLVNALPASSDKDSLIARLQVLGVTNPTSSVEVTNATTKVVQAETYKRDPYLTDAWTLVNALPASSDKDSLIARLNVIGAANQATLLANATAKVIQAETYKRDPYITDAWTLVNGLPANSDKDTLVSRMNAVGSASYNTQLTAATTKVGQAETYKRDPYFTDAKTLVNALPVGADKDALVTRLDAVQAAIHASTLKTATDAVVLYEKYMTLTYKTKAQPLVSALPENTDKTALQARIDAVVMK
jgi:alpha-tubulin suppressor-like RCC1 family protein